MATKIKTKTRPRKLLKKSPKTTALYTADSMETCIGKTADRVRNEIMPRVDLLDQRDREQFNFVMENVGILKGDIGSIKTDMSSLVSRQSEFADKVENTLTSLHTTISTHITDEGKEFEKIHAGQVDLKKGQEEAASAVIALNKLTEKRRMWARWKDSTKTILKTSILFMPFKSTIGTIAAAMIGAIVINSITRFWGFAINLEDFFNLLLKLFGSK